MSNIEIRLTNLEKGYEVQARKIKLILQELELKTLQLDLLNGMIKDVYEICGQKDADVERFIGKEE